MKKMQKGLILAGMVIALLCGNEVFALEMETESKENVVETESIAVDTEESTEVECTETAENEETVCVQETEVQEIIETQEAADVESETVETTEEVKEEEISVELTLADSNAKYENKDVYDFVVRMYDKFLNRSVDAEGLDTWYNVLVNHEMDAAEVVDGFVSSGEFYNKNLSTEDYIGILYEGIMGRTADAEGMNTWSGILEDGVSRRYISSKFVESEEFKELCKQYDVVKGSIKLTENRDQNLTITQFVSHFYENCLDRKGDADGLNTWTGGLLGQTYTGADITYGFVDSKEFQGKNLTDEDFVKVLYQTLLMREYDQAGLTTWVDYLEHGVSDDYILRGFVHSNEFSGFCSEHKIQRGNVVLSEARDKNYELTKTVDQLYETVNQKAPEGKELNAILEPMYRGEISAHEMISEMFGKQSYKNLNKTDKDYVMDIYKTVFDREASSQELETALENIQKKDAQYALDRIVLGKEFSEKCLEYGVELMDYMDIPAMKYAKEVLDELDWDLEAGFEWSYTDIRYQVTPKPAFGVSHTQYYGKYGFEKGIGNCYVMASAFYWMAKINGWEVYLVEGYVPTTRGYDAIHGWLEVVVDGEIYVCDPSGARKGLNAYMIQYGDKGSYMYKNYQRYD